MLISFDVTKLSFLWVCCVTWEEWIGYPVSLKWGGPCHWIRPLSYVKVVTFIVKKRKLYICAHTCKVNCIGLCLVIIRHCQFLGGDFQHWCRLLWFSFWSLCCYQIRASICSETTMYWVVLSISSHCRMKMVTLLKPSMAYQRTKIIRHSQFRYQLFNLLFPLK